MSASVRLAGAHHGDDGSFGKLEPSLDVEQRRRRIDMGEGRGIALLAHGDESSPGAVGGGFELGVSLCFLTFAGYQAISLTLGSIYAALIVGSAFLVGGLVATVVVQARRR